MNTGRWFKKNGTVIFFIIFFSDQICYSLTLWKSKLHNKVVQCFRSYPEYRVYAVRNVGNPLS